MSYTKAKRVTTSGLSGLAWIIGDIWDQGWRAHNKAHRRLGEWTPFAKLVSGIMSVFLTMCELPANEDKSRDNPRTFLFFPDISDMRIILHTNQ